jgi:hypothetical protein
MRSERYGKLLVVPQQIGGFIEILLVAFIASDREVAFESGRRRVDICLAKGNLMLKEKIPSIVKPIVLAHYHPAVTVIFPHANLLEAISLLGRHEPGCCPLEAGCVHQSCSSFPKRNCKATRKL